MFKDRAAPVEVFKKYGLVNKWVQRNPITAHDVEAPRVNANVNIATRAIADAIAGLPVRVVTVESVGGIDREVEDSDHPANIILKMPNPTNTWSEFINFMVKSYLLDGNAIATIERSTGPNLGVEIWPRDPRYVEISKDKKKYRFGQHSSVQITFPRNRIVHIRDMDTSDPFWGMGRLQSVRDEIMMDFYVNQFNSKFFENGALFSLMFTPDHDLTEDQHTEILDALNADLSGVDKAFGLFINRFAGKIEKSGQTHNRIAFMDLLKHNREKIFGVFGLPPFRGGVMEFANYANALAQDLDFWNNTIRPILTVLEDGFNKQLIWPIFGTEVKVVFDIESVPAIQGDESEKIKNLLALKGANVVSAEYVREQLDISEDAAPDEPEPVAKPEDGDEEQPTEPAPEEEREVQNAVFRLIKQHRLQIIERLRELTVQGVLMGVLCDPDSQSKRLYKLSKAASDFRRVLLPIFSTIVHNRSKGKLKYDDCVALVSAKFDIDNVIESLTESLEVCLYNAEHSDLELWQLEKAVNKVFNNERASSIAKTLVHRFVNGVELAKNSQTSNSGNGNNDSAIVAVPYYSSPVVSETVTQ
jgi:HK97 family phage portal protein